MKYALTGNRGLIGTFLKKRMDKDKHKCVLLIDRREGFDVMDLMFKGYIPSKIPDIFLHFAAQCRINEAIANPLLPHRNNVDGALAVLEFCRKYKIPKIVMASTSRVLSKERNPYVASKIYCEELTKAYHDCYGLEYLIIRPSTVYGPVNDETSRLMSNWMVAAFTNQPLRLYGDKTKTLDFTYVDDFVDGVVLAMNGNWNKEYNISGEEEVKLVDVANEIITQTKSKSKVEFFSPEIAQPQQVKVDTTAIRKIGYNPKIDIKEGVRRMVEWYNQHPEVINIYEDKGRKFYK